MGTATSSRRGANDTAEDIAILDVGTCTAEIPGAIIAQIQFSISIERQNNLIIMTYLDLSHVRLGLHICCDSNSYWHQRPGLVSFHDMRRRPWFLLSGLGPSHPPPDVGHEVGLSASPPPFLLQHHVSPPACPLPRALPQVAHPYT